MARPKDPNARAELLAAAARVFVEKGLDAARIEDITRLAGRAKGSFYLHFETKDDAFVEIIEDVTTRLAAVITPTRTEPVKDDVELQHRLRDALEHDIAIFEFLWANRQSVRLILTGAGSARFMHLIDGFAQTAAAQSREWLAFGKAHGLYRHDVDLDVVSLAMAGAYDRVAREMVTKEERPDIRGWIVEVHRMFTLGIGTPKMVALEDGLTGPPRRKDALQVAVSP